ncbi:MAG TPA: DUF6541 family protein [Pseudonocardiaceae bacterium]
MPVHAGFGVGLLTVAIYLVVLWVPGGVAGALLGLRGWLLAASAPVITYFIGGSAGPLLSMLGLRYDGFSFGVCAVIVVALCATARWLTRRRKPVEDTPRPGDWLRSSHAVVAVFVLAAAAAGATMVIGGMHWLDSIPQDWDAAFEANGIRYIAETGDGGLFSMANINWYDPANSVFYPNAYHLVATLVYTASKASIPMVLNANTVLVPGLLALGLVTTVRAFRGRVSTAYYVALIAVAATAGVYENMVRGPLLPYGLSVALIPVAIVALYKFLERPALDTGALVVMTTVGLLEIHSSAPFGIVALFLPVLAQHWWRRGKLIGRDVLCLVVVSVCAMIVAAPELLGALHSASAFPSVVWPAHASPPQAIGNLLTFTHAQPYPPFVLTIALWVGLIAGRKLNRLAWTLGSALLAGGLYVAVAAYNSQLIISMTRAWWDDAYRLIVLAFIPLAIIAAHGMTQLQDLLITFFRWVTRQRARQAVAGCAAVVLLVAFVGLSHGLYYRVNSTTVRAGYGTAPTVKQNDMVISPNEVLAMQKLATLVKPGDRVMNDRWDGSVWTYAISGVETVAGHYDATALAPEINLLANDFNQYDTDPAVRAAVANLHVTYAMVDTGFVRANGSRQAGLTNLDHCDFLVPVYANPSATIYRLVPPGTGQQG